MAMTDQQIQLVIAAQNGDVKSFEELYGVYHRKIFALTKIILKNEADAEDILQDTFITAWRKLYTLKAPQTFSVWLQIIARNLCNDQLRKKNIAVLLDDEKDIEDFDTEEPEELLPSVYAERTDLQERLGRIIDRLSDVQRQAIVLYYFNELSVEEVSHVMECSKGTITTRLYLARKTIRAEIEEQEERSGEKFYGIIGIPMLPFSKLIHSYLQSTSMSENAANTSLNAITQSIGSGTETAAAASEIKPEKKNMTLGAKIALIAGIITVISISAVLLATMISGGKNSGEKPSVTTDNNTTASNMLKLNKSVFLPGEKIAVTVTGDIAQVLDGTWNGAWIGIYKTGAAHDEYSEYQYVGYYENESAEQKFFTAPDEAGSYEICLFHDNGSAAEGFITAVSFTVSKANNPDK